MQQENALENFEASFIRRREAAKYCKAKYGFGSEKSFAILATIGGGPKMAYAGRLPLYKQEWIDTWALSKISRPVGSTIRKDRTS